MCCDSCDRAPGAEVGMRAWCACGDVSAYGAFRDYLGSFVCIEIGQCGRLKFLHDSKCS